jgi:hypothetical protein
MFNQKIDLHNPDVMVDLKDLSFAKDIYKILRQSGIKKKYCYALLYRKNLLVNEIIKIGESCPEPNEKTTPALGERLTRQAAWLDGWPRYPKSPNGNELRFNMLEEIKLENLPKNVIHKDNIIIAAWNLDNKVPLVDMGKDRYITQWVEGDLAQQYKNGHDNLLPVLNYKDPTQNKIYKSGWESTKIMQDMFVFE